MGGLDKIKFKEVFKKYYNPLCNFAANIVDDSRLAQDIVQDVFTKIWDKRNQIEISSNEKSYLFQAVKNQALEEIRKNKNRRDNDLKKYPEMKEGSNRELEEQKYMLKEQLFVSMRQLPPKCQQIFRLSKLDGLTYAEIAEKLDISVKTVENQMGKAFRILREKLAGKLSEI